MSYLQTVLRTKEAQTAIEQGFSTWFSTGNLGYGVDAMFYVAEHNGSLLAAKLAFLLDIIDALRR
jgi:hypothetical protein